jgi:hypothetical protein
MLLNLQGQEDILPQLLHPKSNCGVDPLSPMSQVFSSNEMRQTEQVLTSKPPSSTYLQLLYISPS